MVESDNHSDSSSASRRSYLKKVGAVGTVASVNFLAGCSGGDNGNGNGGGGGGNGNGNGGATTTQGGMETLTLGAAISMSGDLAKTAELYTDSYEMTVEDINEEGGVEVGGTQYELDLQLVDDESNASRSRELFQRLIQQDGIDYLLGPYSSGVTLAARPVIENNERPMVQAGAASTDVYQESNEWMFGLLAIAPLYATTAMDLAATFDDPAVETIGFASENEPFSLDAREQGAIPHADELGWDVVVDEQFPTDTEDLTPILNQVSENEPDAFIMLGHRRHAVLLVEQMEQQGINVPFVAATVGGTDPQFIEEVGESGNYLYGPSHWDNQAEFDGFFYGTAKDYVDRFEQMYDYSPDYHNAAASASILTYLHAFEQVDELAPRPVRDAVAETDIMTCYGKVAFTETGQADRPMVLYQWQDGEKNLVYPMDVARSDAVYPMPNWSDR
jgi:branched-chain amino acid transport system substrate-binding protein